MSECSNNTIKIPIFRLKALSNKKIAIIRQFWEWGITNKNIDKTHGTNKEVKGFLYLIISCFFYLRQKVKKMKNCEKLIHFKQNSIGPYVKINKL